MQLFIDSANLQEIKEFAEIGIISGVTTNPSLINKNGDNIKSIIAEIAEIVEGPISAEVTANDANSMIEQGKILADIAENVIVKLPITKDGLTACSALASQEIPVNMTLCFSAMQGLTAARAGAMFVSPFIGRIDDISQNGISLIKDLRQIFDNGFCETQILAASIRTSSHVFESAMAGADAATIPAKILHELYKHPLTDKGLEIFNQASKNQKI